MCVHEPIQYMEFLSNDLQRTKKFCQDIFNWNFTDYCPTYASFDAE